MTRFTRKQQVQHLVQIGSNNSTVSVCVEIQQDTHHFDSVSCRSNEQRLNSRGGDEKVNGANDRASQPNSGKRKNQDKHANERHLQMKHAIYHQPFAQQQQETISAGERRARHLAPDMRTRPQPSARMLGEFSSTGER